jgi:hypothetical protein
MNPRVRRYGSIVDTRDTTALKVTFSGPSSWTIPGKITLEPPHPSLADLPQFAAVKGFANTNSDVGPGLYKCVCCLIPVCALITRGSYLYVRALRCFPLPLTLRSFARACLVCCCCSRSPVALTCASCSICLTRPARQRLHPQHDVSRRRRIEYVASRLAIPTEVSPQPFSSATKWASFQRNTSFRTAAPWMFTGFWWTTVTP